MAQQAALAPTAQPPMQVRQPVLRCSAFLEASIIEHHHRCISKVLEICKSAPPLSGCACDKARGAVATAPSKLNMFKEVD